VDGGRRRGAAAGSAERGEEVLDLRPLRPNRRQAVLVQEPPVLEQVGAIRLERVARQAALELEVGEEIEQQVLKGSLCDGLGDRCDTACFARRSPPP
jgi:hypothetical protein